MSITLDSRQIKTLENTLEVMAKKGIHNASRDTLNMTVANGRKSARRIIEDKFVIKGAKSQNPALRFVAFEKTNAEHMKNQVAILGHQAAFWPKQEFGGTITKKGKQGLAIPTGAAANQPYTTKRTKQPTARNRLSRIKLASKRVQAKSRQQRNAILIRQAQSGDGPKEVFLNLGRTKGIFRIQRKKVIMLYDMSEDTATLRPRPAIREAANRQGMFIPENYQRALLFQMRKAQRGR